MTSSSLPDGSLSSFTSTFLLLLRLGSVTTGLVSSSSTSASSSPLVAFLPLAGFFLTAAWRD